MWRWSPLLCVRAMLRLRTRWRPIRPARSPTPPGVDHTRIRAAGVPARDDSLDAEVRLGQQRGELFGRQGIGNAANRLPLSIMTAPSMRAAIRTPRPAARRSVCAPRDRSHGRDHQLVGLRRFDQRLEMRQHRLGLLRRPVWRGSARSARAVGRRISVGRRSLGLGIGWYLPCRRSAKFRSTDWRAARFGSVSRRPHARRGWRAACPASPMA